MNGEATTIITGALVKPAEIKENGFVKFSIPTGGRKGKNGQRATTWYNLTMFPRNDAPHPVAEFLVPGKIVHVTARMETTTNEATGKTYTDFIVDNIKLIGDAARREDSSEE